MKSIVRTLRETTVTYSNCDLTAVATFAAVAAWWACAAEGSFSFGVLVACEVVFFAFYFAGALVSAFKPLALGLAFDLPLRLLVGYGVVNTTLLVLAWISPLGMVANFGIIGAVLLALLLTAKVRKRRPRGAAGYVAIGIAAVATTLWCQDFLDPTLDRGSYVIFKPWVDGFYHAVHIRIFAESHGPSTIEDFRMVGVVARPYHYGVYMLPALVKAATGLHSYSLFAGLLAPVGVFFTGLAAYSLIGSLWGAWPGVAACIALLLLPDGAQQGMDNTFLSYHWLTHISPSATYGLSLLAVAWLFIFSACKRTNRHQLLAGWLLAAVILAYKVHYVIASALLMLIIPALFFGAALGVGRRALLVVTACALYVAALFVGQEVPGVPVIRLDGSSSGEILHLVHSFVKPGPFKDFVTEFMGRDATFGSNLLYGVPYVLVAVLGAFVLLLLALLIGLRRRISTLELLFPLLIITNFVVMFFGLALDFSSSTPDELNHRPLMIVYFFVAAWVGGALGLLLRRSRLLQRFSSPILIGSALLLLVVPARLGPGLQLMWVMPDISPFRVPRDLVHVAEYMRTHGEPTDVFQDSRFDRFYALAALSERRTFVAHTLTIMPHRAEMVGTRSTAVNRLMTLDQPKMVNATARAFGIRWFVLHPGNRVNWPPALEKNPVYASGPFKVYDFDK